MARHSNMEMADCLARRRSQPLSAMTVLFAAAQLMLIGDVPEALPWLDLVRLVFWSLCWLVLLLCLATGGELRRKNAPVEDEVTRDNRRRSLADGFLAAMVVAVLFYALSFLQPFGPRYAIHMIVSLGIGAALLEFALLERRARRNG